MSRFLESCKCIEAPMCLHKEGFFYLLNETVRERAPKVFESLKGEKYIHRIDLYPILENIAVNTIMLPFAVFMHSQKACHMIMGLQCVECNENWHDEFEITRNYKETENPFRKINIKKEKDEREREII
ncbi:hypothetical protein L3Y34_017065 [Caenorhabditis briggsae]|uniref:Uncharacterized protein n=1 Tax=Caenorhabditis briggsae TaxID=6238 RepID=A0AAE9DH81_CAEBR|nr:hypothetical protein L3Y34_017065 [Caenorhabditis briggsae]